MQQNFDAYLINLDRDTARLAHMREQLQAQGVTFTRLPAVLGDAMPEALRPYFFDEQGRPKTALKRGEIGCYASHLHLMTLIAALPDDRAVLVMEDDLVLCADFVNLLNQALTALPAHWGILRLSNAPRRAYVPVARLAAGFCVALYSRIPTRTGAYVIRPAAARQYLAQGFQGNPVDVDLRYPWIHGLESYGIVPPPAQTGGMASSIDDLSQRPAVTSPSPALARLARGDHRRAAARLLYMVRYLGFGRWLACSAINLADGALKPFMRQRFIHRAANWF